MKEPASEFKSFVLTQPLDYVVEPDEKENESRWFAPFVLIAQLVYAVIIVGFLGYFFDKAFNQYR